MNQVTHLQQIKDTVKKPQMSDLPSADATAEAVPEPATVIAGPQLKLKTSDDKVFEVDRELAKKSVTISHLLEDLDEADEVPIPIPNVKSDIMQMIVTWLQAHKNDVPLTEEQQEERRAHEFAEWDAKFFDLKLENGNPDLATLFNLILAANFLDIQQLLIDSCKSVALLIRGKDCAEIRKLFGIHREFTKEEMDAVKKEHPWCDPDA